ncbi:hypothetical protein [Streptomyces sp. NPDC059378]|uniref:hypothetical protein n=1 Tax=Streptomyces sp. NPDC059378 TaxID=3346815 RepID=UPI0036A2CF76
MDAARIQQKSLDRAIVADQRLIRDLDLKAVAAFQPGDATALTSSTEDELEALQSLFPDQAIDPDLGFGTSGADPNAKRTKNVCSRDFPSTDPSFYYVPMTRFGPNPDDCRATGAVAFIDSFDLRPWRLNPKWKPAGYYRLPVEDRAALHLIGNQMGGAHDTLRNFVAAEPESVMSEPLTGRGPGVCGRPRV